MQRRQFLTTATAALVATAVPRFTTAAGPVTVKIGFLDSFTGVFSDIAAYHKAGAELALADLNRSGRVRFELVTGDDGSKPAGASTEARRLIAQDGVDAIFGGTSSGSALALARLCDDLGTFNLALGPFDSALTGEKAAALTYRFGANSRMLLRPMANRLLALGKKWYFVQADYALGKDAYAQLGDVLRRAGGSESGHDVLPLGTSDFSSVMTKVRSSGADVLVLANSGIDAANAIKAYAAFGLDKKMQLAGINLEDFYYKAVPLDAIAGATFTVLWAPDVSDSARALARRLSKSIAGPISARHYYGYAALAQLGDRIRAAGTTDPVQLAAAFADHSFEGYKQSRSRFNGCDHQNAQDVYAGAIRSAAAFAKTGYLFDVIATVPAGESDGTCDSPWARAAKSAIAEAKIGRREGYTAKKFDDRA